MLWNRPSSTANNADATTIVLDDTFQPRLTIVAFRNDVVMGCGIPFEEEGQDANSTAPILWIRKMSL